VSDPVVCRQFVISGKVQGVFFRASTARQADHLGLAGSAVNLPDGRVEIIACGAESRVDALAHWLASGPPLAKVTRIEARNLDPAIRPHHGFSIGVGPTQPTDN